MKAQGAAHDTCGYSEEQVSWLCKTSLVKKFKLVYSRDGTSWIPLSDKIGEAAATFDQGATIHGNVPGFHGQSKEGNPAEEYTFPSTSHDGLGPFEARYIRMYILQFASNGRSTVNALCTLLLVVI